MYTQVDAAFLESIMIIDTCSISKRVPEFIVIKLDSTKRQYLVKPCLQANFSKL